MFAQSQTTEALIAQVVFVLYLDSKTYLAAVGG
jgi:hypothetical protein